MDKYDFYDEAVANVRYIVTRSEAIEVLHDLADSVVALDFETTGLDPKYSKVRLSCIYHPTCGAVIIDHFLAGSFEELMPHMLSQMWAVYNAKFEVRWFDHFERNTSALIDVDFLAKAHRGGYASSLRFMAKRDLGIDMDKTEQLSDWSKLELTSSQIKYAALDGVITYKLYELWAGRCNAAQREAAFTFQDAVRATVECEDTGMVLDVDVHQKNIDVWKRKQITALKRVRNWTSAALIPNLNSNVQVGKVIATQLGKDGIKGWPVTPKAKQLQLSRNIIGPIAAKASYPFSRWLNSFMLYRYYNKYLSTYGDTLLTKQMLSDKIEYRLNIGQAATGRYSSSSINIQNIPRAPYVRKAFTPADGFTRFVVADYSSIEVRVLAELSQDKRLLEDAIYGDVHSGSASTIYHIDEQFFMDVIASGKTDLRHDLYPTYSELRSKSKGFTFQNIYGAQAAALSLVLKCSVAEAEDAVKAWAARYPDAYNYRYIMYDKMMQTGYLPVCDGRTIFVPKMDRTIPVASNYGIQGAAGSVMLKAMSRVYDLREQKSSRNLIRLSATVHDELILATTPEHIPLAKSILEEGMTQGWLDVFPDTSTHGLVEAKSGINWGTAK